ncbi:MAG: hypothetical protein KGI08_10080 [Thaumarchaeota archaeon]|nr:hypothetical protein [Nitrososphaerota archaeon]
MTGSASRLYIDGKKYYKKAFQDFLDYVDNTEEGQPAPDPSKRYFAEYGRQFFVWPSYSGVAPSLNSILWGNIQTPPLATAATLTVFSQWNDELNEAILQKALSVAMGRIDTGFSNENLQLAISALDQQWGKVVAEMQRSQRLNHPFFNVIDMFNQNAGQATIGNFAFANGGY